MKNYRNLILALLALIGAAPFAALADQRGHGWHGDIRHFEYHDAHQWHSGGWHHGYHNGYLGWWWVVGAMWYFYPQPVYPYPDPYTPPVVVIQQPANPVVIAQPSPSAPPSPGAPPAAAPQPPQYWYYCDASSSYYPYVASCAGGWKMVPAKPADVPQ